VAKRFRYRPVVPLLGVAFACLPLRRAWRRARRRARLVPLSRQYSRLGAGSLGTGFVLADVFAPAMATSSPCGSRGERRAVCSLEQRRLLAVT